MTMKPKNVIWTFIVTHADGRHGGRVFFYLCLSVFFRTISQKPMQLTSPNLTQKCSKVKVTSHKNVAGVGLCTLVLYCRNARVS